MARERRRSKAAEHRLYPQNVSLGWRVVKRIAYEVGEALIQAGHAILVFDQTENRYDYQLVDERPVDNGLVPARPTPASLTARDARLIAGLHGRSRTAGMLEQQRLVRCDPRTGAPLPPEDAVERAQAKLAMYLHPASRDGDKAVRVYPKAS